MNKQGLFLILTIGLFLSGCQKTAEIASKEEGIGTGNLATWNDPNFEIIEVFAYNYTYDDIYSIIMLPINKNDIDAGVEITAAGGTPTNAKTWNGGGGGRPALAWDLRWTSPHKFKVWWLHVFDITLAKATDKEYDIYTNPKAQPGTAWCEGEVEIKEEFIPFRHDAIPSQTMLRDEMMLYFYPDGTVKGHLLESGRTADETPVELVDITKRDELPTLKGRACIKEVPNPYYGKPRPKQYTY